MLTSTLVQKITESLENNESVALITIVHSPNLDLLGHRILLWQSGQLCSASELSSSMKSAISEACLPLLEKQKSKTIALTYESMEIECFVEIYTPSPRVIIAGAGHVGEAVARLGVMLGFHVTVVDDRQSFANRERFPYVDQVICQSFLHVFQHIPIMSNTYILLVTRGHRFDVLSLQEILRRTEKPAYIGMIGSRRRITGVFEQVKQDFPTESLQQIFAPVGLDIGAETPEEIAVSIFAEMLKVKHKRSGKSHSEDLRKFTLLDFK